MKKSHGIGMTLLLAGAVLGACTQSRKDVRDAAFKEFQDSISQIAGVNPRDCGTLDPQPSQELLYNAARCVNAAWKSKIPFRLVREQQGVDSELWLAYVSNGTVVTQLNFDSDIKGGGGDVAVPRVERRECREFEVRGTQTELFVCSGLGVQP